MVCMGITVGGPIPALQPTAACPAGRVVGWGQAIVKRPGSSRGEQPVVNRKGAGATYRFRMCLTAYELRPAVVPAKSRLGA